VRGKKLGCNAVTVSQISREAAVVYFTLSAGGAASLENSRSTAKGLGTLEGKLCSLHIIFGYVTAVTHKHLIPYPFAGGTGGGKSTVLLGTNGQQHESVTECDNVSIRLALTVVTAANTKETCAN
jgi:hypothetical protein